MTETADERGLFRLLKERRAELIARWSRKVEESGAGKGVPTAELLDRIPFFVDELIAALYPDAVPLPPPADNAEEHGSQRLRLGFDVAEVVREYGSLHVCIFELAREADVAITLGQHEVIARWLNAGIATAVSEYVQERDAEFQRQNSEHLGFIAHEVRNPLAAALMAFTRLRKREGYADSSGVQIVDRNLRRAAEVIDGTLTHAFLKLGVPPRLEWIELRKLLEECRLDAGAEGHGRGIQISMTVEDNLTIEADPRLLRSAVSNLLHNALKFSNADGTVTLKGHADDDRVTIDVADACGGLPPGKAEELFAPLVQRNQDRSGVGLGLSIAVQAIEAHKGTIRVRDIPGVGCVFTVEIPARTKRA
jgi:signal transduction histidine kinase